MPETEGTRQRNSVRMAFIIDQYDKAHGKDSSQSTEPHLIANWAVEQGLFKRPPVSPQEYLRKLIARHLRNEQIKDPQGREVRKWHNVLYEVQTEDGPRQRSRWFQIFNAPAKHMLASLQIRRRSALSDVGQLDLDFHSYNENNIFGETLPPMDYNFNKDLEEMRESGTYPDAPADEDEDGDPI